MGKHTMLRLGPLRFRDPVLLCGVLYGLLLFDASGFLRTGLLAAFLHEWGHILVYCAQQRRFPVIEVTLTGFCMRLGRAELSPAQRFRLAAAGPAVNFALAGVWAVLLSRQATVRGSAFWAANLLTGGVCHFDGGLYGLQVRRRERHAAPLHGVCIRVSHKTNPPKEFHLSC